MDIDTKTQFPLGKLSQQSGRDFKASIPTSNPRANDKSNSESLRQGPPHGEVGGHTFKEVSDLRFERFARNLACIQNPLSRLFNMRAVVLVDNIALQT
jgi:hypothetical protein